jgi:hypothetical protein
MSWKPALQHPTKRGPEVLDPLAIEDKIASAAERGIFLALAVDPRRARDAEAEARRVQWPNALAADAAGREVLTSRTCCAWPRRLGVPRRESDQAPPGELHPVPPG